MKILPNIIFSRQSCNKQKHHSPIDRLVIECNGIIITWVTWLFEVCTDSVPRPSKCTEVVGGWGFAPDPTGGAYSAPPDPLAGFRGPTSKGRGGEGRRREGILLRNSFRGLVTPLADRVGQQQIYMKSKLMIAISQFIETSTKVLYNTEFMFIVFTT